MELAEQDIAAALKVQSNADVLALRQRLLRLRNTAAPTHASPSSSPSFSPSKPMDAASPAARQEHLAASVQPPSSSRQQSDAQKELGNTAMAEKHYSTAVMHYTNAIKFDSTNLAAFNNRALAYLKLTDFELAEGDASCVVDGKGGADAQSLRLKALCRRAQARRSMGEKILRESAEAQSGAGSSRAASMGRVEAVRGAQGRFEGAMQDLLLLLRDDANNKTALAEQKAVKDALKRCSDELAPAASIASKAPNTLAPSTAASTGSSSSSSSSSSPVPRADPSRVSAMLSPSGSAAASPSFGDIGLVARSSEKLRAAGCASEDAPTTTTPSAPSTPVPAAKTAAAAASSSDKKEKGAAGSPAPSIVLTTAPSEPPKTVYE